MSKVIVLGAGLSGLASAALLARAGHEVTVLERHNWLGGKSRRVTVAGQIMDTGPALVTFTGVWDKLLESYDQLGEKQSKTAREIADLEFVKLNELGRYYYKDEVTDLPVKPDHKWFEPWQRFEKEHAPLTEPITELLTKLPLDPKALPALAKIQRRYGIRLTTSWYLNALKWLPQDLKDIIAIHTLNAGIAPSKTLALYASMTAVMATDGIRVPVGGVNEIAQSLGKLATAAGVTINFNEEITSIKKRSCSGIAIYGVLAKPLPKNTVTHSVVMPDDPNDLYKKLEGNRLPNQTMAFVNYYKAQEIYPNNKPTVAVLLTAPADGGNYDIQHPWVKQEITRISNKLGLKKPITELFEDHIVLDPAYFGSWGAPGGALYGATKPVWQSGPFHSPQYMNPIRPWLYRVGASVHPGGGIPAVLGGAMNSIAPLLKKN
jgi:phytoene desaturase